VAASSPRLFPFLAGLMAPLLIRLALEESVSHARGIHAVAARWLSGRKERRSRRVLELTTPCSPGSALARPFSAAAVVASSNGATDEEKMWRWLAAPPADAS